LREGKGGKMKAKELIEIIKDFPEAEIEIYAPEYGSTYSIDVVVDNKTVRISAKED
jgi:hypothetical protein